MIKFKININYKGIADETEFYNELIENSCSHEDAINIIKKRLNQELSRINMRADNVFWMPYEIYHAIEEYKE